MHRRKYYSAAFLVLLGVGVMLQSLQYDIGTLSHMGSGYYPLLLGVAMIVVGLLVFWQASREPAGGDVVRWKPLIVEVRRHARAWLAVVGSVVAFLVLGKYGGLVPASFVMILVAALGDRENSLRAAVALALGVTIVAVAAFSFGLQLQFPLFTWG